MAEVTDIGLGDEYKMSLRGTKTVIKSLAPGSLRLVFLKLISTIDILNIFCEFAIRSMPQDLKID